MTDIVWFIRARLAERADRLDRLIHYQVNHGDVPGMDGGWEYWGDFGYLVSQVVDFRQMRRDVEAKRRIVDEFEARNNDAELMLGPETRRQREWAGLRLSVRLLASEWSTHDDYRQEWTP